MSPLFLFHSLNALSTERSVAKQVESAIGDSQHFNQ